MPDTYELEQLRILIQKYGSHYIGKYFGVSMKQIAEAMGLTPDKLNFVITGRRKAKPIELAGLSEIFRRYDIAGKALIFKETSSQLAIKELRRRAKNLLTIWAFGCILQTMVIHAYFFKTANSNWQECIDGECAYLAQFSKNLKAACVAITLAVCVFLDSVAQKIKVFCTRPSYQKVGFLL